jgi:hypothetical protein
MRILHRLLARTLLAPFLLLPLLSCGYPKPSPKEVVAALGRTTAFTGPRTALVARRVEAKTRDSWGGGAINDTQLASVDWVLSVLHANKLIDIQDVYGPAGETGGYLHILTITPAADAPTDLFVATDEEAGGPSWQAYRKTPGWRVTLGRREVVSVSQVLDSNNPQGERLSPGYVLANFAFHWIPTEIGKLFDQGSLGFDDLSENVQRAAIQAGAIDSRETYYGKAWLTRDRKTGAWTVTLFDCRRCGDQL